MKAIPLKHVSSNRAETSDEVTRRIVSLVSPERAALFGSSARGDMGADSDLDLLVIVKGQTSHFRRVAQVSSCHW